MNLNKKAILKNPYQGDAKKVLCVCSAGVLRSPTAAVVLQREYGYNTRSAGISDDIALVPVTEELCEWADEIVVMESWMAHQEPIATHQGKLVCLDIEDNYEYMNHQLQEIIKERYYIIQHEVDEYECIPS